MAMPQWLKAVLLMAAVGIFAVGALIGGIVWWIRSNKDRLISEGRAVRDEGLAFGRTHAMSECIDDSLTHLDGCGAVDLVCETGVRLRLSGCLSVAKKDGTCEAVPARTEIFKMAMWGNAECARRGHAGSQACGRVLQAVADACGGMSGSRSQ